MRHNECFGRSRDESLYPIAREAYPFPLERSSFALDAILETRSSCCSSAILGHSRLNLRRMRKSNFADRRERREVIQTLIASNSDFLSGLAVSAICNASVLSWIFTSMMHHAHKDSVYCFAVDCQLFAANKSFLVLILNERYMIMNSLVV